MADQSASITLGGGCFWCVEAVFENLRGVARVVSGYAGGHVPNPTYRQVCEKTTGHAEVVQVSYDPQQVSLRELLEVFFTTHDPTTPNRQGADVGPQYRSIILYATKSRSGWPNRSSPTSAARACGTRRSSPSYSRWRPSTRPSRSTTPTTGATPTSRTARR